MLLEILTAIVLAISGLVLMVFGVKLAFRSLRRLPTSQSVIYAFLGASLLSWGLGISGFGLMLLVSPPEAFTIFILFFVLGLVFGCAAAIGQYAYRLVSRASVRRGVASQSDFFPYDKSPK